MLPLSPKFWELHQDPLMAMDGGAMTLITIQVNLTSGTIARQAVHRPELIPLVDDLLNYRKQYARALCSLLWRSADTNAFAADSSS